MRLAKTTDDETSEKRNQFQAGVIRSVYGNVFVIPPDVQMYDAEGSGPTKQH